MTYNFLAQGAHGRLKAHRTRGDVRPLPEEGRRPRRRLCDLPRWRQEGDDGNVMF